MASQVLLKFSVLPFALVGVLSGSMDCLWSQSAANPRLENSAEGWGHLKGRIVVEGNVPPAKELIVDADRAFCLAQGQKITDRSLLVGDGGGLQDAFVMLYLSRGAEPPAVHPSYEEKLGSAVEVSNTKCRFEPTAVFLRTGQALLLKNDDAVGHNCHVVTMRNETNVNLPAGDSIDVKFTEADRLPGIIKCDIHKWMEATVLVRDEPYVAISDAKGNFLIEHIPAGTWTFQFWHKRAGYLKGLARDGNSLPNGRLEVTIQDGQTLDLGDMLIPVQDLLPRE